MTQASTNQTFHLQTNQHRNNDVTDGNSVEFRNGTPADFENNAKRIWVDQITEYLNYTVDGVDIHTLIAQDGIGFVMPQWFGALGNGVNNDTLAFQNAAATGLPIIVPKPSNFYLVTAAVNLTNSITGIGFPRIFIPGTGSQTFRLLNIIDQTSKHIEITGLNLDGGYTSGTAGEQSHLVHIRGSKNVSVYNNKIERPYGDCIYVGGGVSDPTTYSENINIFRNELLAPRRCVISVSSAKKVNVDNNYMTHLSGYVSMIDLEPNNANDTTLDDITIKNNTYLGTLYFVNFIDPIVRTSSRLQILNNNGSSSIMFRVSGTGAGSIQTILLQGNTFTGSGRFISAGSLAQDLVITNNFDYATDNAGWNIDTVLAPFVADNTIHSSRSSGISFTNCQNVQLSSNTFRDVFSSSAVVVFKGTNPQTGHLVLSNHFINSDYSTQWRESVFSSCLVDGNYFDFNRRAVDIVSTSTGSDIRVTSNNRYAGAGTTRVVGTANNMNQSDGYVTAISAAPNFIGQIAVVGALIYMASGTTAAGDWKQISN